MDKKSQSKIGFLVIFSCIAILYSFTQGPIAQPAYNISYEFLDGGEIIHYWNDVDDYYLNASSGIQITNYYDEYWTHNIFCAGYKTASWNYLCTDDLPITLSAYSDNSSYVQINGTRQINIAGYDVIIGIDYYLELTDAETEITTGIKNIDGDDITVDIGFAWRTNDIKIGNTEEWDKIVVNLTQYDLNSSLDMIFNNLTHCYGDIGNGSYTCNEYPYYSIEDRNPSQASLNPTNFTALRWNPNLNYFVQLKSELGQTNAPVTLVIITSGLLSGQTKQTTLFWKDPIVSGPSNAEGWYDMPNEFHVPEIAAADNNDQLFFNLTNSNDAAGQSLRAQGASETTTGAYAHLFRGGFTEGFYSLTFTGLVQEDSAQSNSFTVATRDSDNSFRNFSYVTLDWPGGAVYQANTSTAILDGGNDGYGVSAFVNSTGVLDFKIWANSSSTSFYTRLSAVNVTNYTAFSVASAPSSIVFDNPANDSFEKHSEVRVDVSFSDDDEDGCIFSVVNTTTTTAINYSNFTIGDDQCSLNFTFADGNVNMTVFVNDSSDYHTQSDMLNFTVDTTTPASLDYVDPTLANGSYTNKDWVDINITFTDLSASECLVEYNNGTATNYTGTITNDYCFFNATSQPIGNWNYSVYINDSAGYYNKTDMRHVSIYPELFVRQWAEFYKFNNTHVHIQLNVVVYNNDTEDTYDTVNVSVDTDFTSFIIHSLPAGTFNTSSEMKIVARGAADAWYNFTNATLSIGASGTSNLIGFMNPIDPPSKTGSCGPPAVNGQDWLIDLNNNCTKLNGETVELGTLRVYGDGGYLYLINYNISVDSAVFNFTNDHGGVVLGPGSRIGRG